MKKIKLYIAIPSVGTVSDIHPYAFRQYEKEYGDKIEFVYPAHCTQRKFHDFARNALIEDFLATDCDVIWFIDSDVVPPPHTLDLLTKHYEHWDLAGCPYPVFITPTGSEYPKIVMCVYASDGTNLHAARVPQEGVGFVDGLATGCIFIKRAVLEKMSKPYFEFKFDPETKQLAEGEDLGFCRKVNALGYKFFTDFSMACKHYKTVDLLDVNNYAILFAKDSVEAYDATIRPMINVLQQRLTARKAPAIAPAPSSGLILPDHYKV